MNDLTDKNIACLGCLKCCRSIAFYTAITEDMGEQYWADAIYFYKARGFTVTFHDVNIDGKDKRVLAIEINDFPCPHLTDTGCDIYETRPNACRRYDGRTEMGDKCAWSTIKEDVNEKA